MKLSRQMIPGVSRTFHGGLARTDSGGFFLFAVWDLSTVPLS
ncbi:hypothetical protein [Pseudoglutamicibacter cumminsii]|nr:hypothetical protein [Pseudoglutamicibacter cumminsii]